MKLGDYELNNIYCGDSAVMLKALPDAGIDLTVTSPPYDNLRTYNGYSWDFDAIATQLYRVTKPGGVVVWVVGDATVNGSETGSSFRQALGFMEIGFNLHDTMIYCKEGTPPLNHKRYEQAFEYMFVFSVGSPANFNSIMGKSTQAGKKTTGTIRNGGSDSLGTKHGIDRPVLDEKIVDNVWSYPVGKNKTTKDGIAFDHPAIFPEALARDHIISWSNPGDIILDPFSGSGTTAKMAKMLQRQFIGFDISQEYVDLAKRRIAAAPVPLPFVVDEPVVKAEQLSLVRCD